ncbi:hypothetical protein BKA63DRAFT_498576 [Paraphoma chrysanthemicola]|nr:hypothetical protein BKA63DRAFT_498576 [Paraphoma chrysanthemicola]
MSPFSIALHLVVSFIVHANAAPIEPPNTPASTTASSWWSRQDILTLVSVIVAIGGIFIVLFISLPKFRTWFSSPYMNCMARRHESSRRRRQQGYEEWV